MVAPVEGDPTLMPPGCFFDSSINSGNVLTLSDGVTRKDVMIEKTFMIGTKSFLGS